MKLLSKFLLIMLHTLHISILLFVVIGWLLPVTRPWHLLMCLLIISSWFGVGAWKGWGYCLITDLQWRLLRRLGMASPAFGYVPMLWQRVTGRSGDAHLVDLVTQAIFYLSVVASLWVNWSWLQTYL